MSEASVTVSKEEAADLIGVSRRKLAAMIQQKEIAVFRWGGPNAHPRIPRSEIDRIKSGQGAK